MSTNPLNDISRVYLEQVAAVDEGMSMKDFKANRRKLKRREASADAKKRGHVGKEWYNSGRTYSPDEAKSGRANMPDHERQTRHRSAVDPDNDNDDMYSADKTKNPKKLRKQKAMGELGESAVPGKPAERLGAVTAIPKSEQEAARERILAKTKAKREAMKTEALDSVGKEDADVDNDGKKNTKSDNYLLNRRKAIGKAISTQEEKEVKKWWDDDGDGKGWEEGEVSGKFKKKKKVKEAKVYDPMEDDDFDHDEAEKNRGVSGKNNPKGGKPVKMKEGYSNWRRDLSEVMGDEDDEADTKPIKEKKVNNKIKINPTIKEAVEDLGGVLIEMVEIENTDSIFDDLSESEIFLLSDDLIEEVVEEFFYECLEEGYDLHQVEDVLIESIEFSSALLNEAKVTLGHDTKIKSDRLQKVKSAVKKVGGAVARGAGYVAGAAVRGAKAAGREFSKGYERGRGGSSGSSSSSERGSSRPGLIGRIGSALKSGLKKAVAKGARAVSRGARNVARKMEGGSSTQRKPAPYRGAGVGQKEKVTTTTTSKASAPKAKAKAPAKKKKSSKLDDLLSDIRKEEVHPSIQKMDALNAQRVKERASAAAKEKENKAADTAAFQAHKKAHIAAGGTPVSALDSWQKKKMSKEEVEYIDEKTLTSAETKKKERLVKSMKKKAADFENRYPGRGKEVMYATATKMAKKMAEQAMELQPKKQATTPTDKTNKKNQQQQDRVRQQEVQILQRKLQALRTAPKGTDPSITAGYEPEGEMIDERRKEDKVAGTPRKPRNQAFELVAKSMGAGRMGVQPRGKKKVPGKKPPKAGEYGGPASPAQKVQKRRDAAQRAQDMMHSRYD